MDGNVSFDSHSLQTYDPVTRTGIIVDDIDVDNLPTRVVSAYELAHANLTAISYDGYPARALPLTGTLVATTPTALTALLDTFKSYLRGKQKNLDINYNGGTRRWIATLSPNASMKRSVDKKSIKFTIEFICTPGFGMDTTATTALNGTARTSAVYLDNYTFLGTAPYQLPVVTLTLTAVSSTGSQQLTWGNNDNGQGIVITRSTWANADVVVIDCVNKSVKVNGTDVDFAGAFPEFTPGAHIMTYSDTFTSRTMTENVVYNKRYL